MFVIGEAGIGKTTVVDALLEHAAPEVTIARGACVEQYGVGEAYLPVLGGQLGPVPFHWTQLDVASGTARVGDVLAEPVPGRTTRVLAGASARARVSLGQVPGRTTLIANQADSDVCSPDESRGFFRRHVSGGHAARAKLEGAIAPRDHHAAVVATRTLEQDLVSARHHLANGLERDAGLRTELTALEGSTGRSVHAHQGARRCPPALARSRRTCPIADPQDHVDPDSGVSAHADRGHGSTVVVYCLMSEAVSGTR